MAILRKSEIKISCSNIKKSQVGKRDLSPLFWLRFTYTGVKERGGDKSLFPTCDFLMLGEKTDFFPPKAKLKMAKLQTSMNRGVNETGCPSQTVSPTFNRTLVGPKNTIH